jgi:hypothetical protein
MSVRLQVVLDDDELDRIQKLARRHHMTTAAWVRQVLRKALRGEPGAEVRNKLASVRAALDHEYPAPDIDKMLGEIERS